MKIGRRPAGSVQPAAGDLWLGLETSTSTGSIAIWRGGVVYEETQRIQGVHSERVLPAIARALDAAGATPEDVTALAVGSGPGSFTGVRIAASIAKGWASARGTPLFAYSSLLAVAAGVPAGQSVCALFDARRGEVYGACYRCDPSGFSTVLEPGAWPMAALLELLAERDLDPVFAGEAAQLHGAMIERACGSGRILPSHLGMPRAASLLWLRSVAPDAGRVAEPAAWAPSYVRDWKVPEEGAG